MYSCAIRVKPSDVSSDGRIKLRSLLNYFQDTASTAVEDVEGTATELYSRGYAWVLMKYEIEITGELPKLDDEFTLQTYHDPNHGYNTLRMFHAPFVTAKTSWFLVDVETGRPVKPIAHIAGITERDNEDILPNFTEIPDLVDVTHTVSIPVRYHDLDYNGHVNHAVYFEWVYDLSPIDIETHRLRKVCAMFRSGARIGETVRLDFSQESNVSLCRVIRPQAERASAKFMCLWSDDNGE